MPNHRRVDKTQLIIDVDIAFQPGGRVLELHWSESSAKENRRIR
jgi:hypothetical protein